ncbi:MAG: UDP-N-acetylglucosamine 1-carboxyvinyltransferase, partial [Clostridia bacterium]|nr:UDP-N-acetylglucosamine 1-carboxyvinyltransferase [Clostridia bacterium]
GKAELAAAGGCDFGSRPIDQHLLGFERLGAKISFRGDAVVVEAPNGLQGTEIALAMPSVGATANLMLAATASVGETVIHNAAAEPHVMALATFLQDAGAQIFGIGTQTVRVIGNLPLHGTHHTVIPDMIEAGTYLALGMACGGPIRVRDIIPDHLGALLTAFGDMGGRVDVGEHTVTISAPNGYKGAEIVTGPYPAFPTDLHPQMAAVLAAGVAEGEGRVRETVFKSRFGYVEELCRMGAEATVEGDTVCLSPRPLKGCKLRSPDLRGGAALLIAALSATGQSEITNAATIGRGYEHLEAKLRALGAHISVY